MQDDYLCEPGKLTNDFAASAGTSRRSSKSSRSFPHASVLPFALMNSVGTLIAIVSQRRRQRLALSLTTARPDS
jgi:hypothetical protein